MGSPIAAICIGAIRQWVIIGTAQYTTCTIAVMHWIVQGSAGVDGTRARGNLTSKASATDDRFRSLMTSSDYTPQDVAALLAAGTIQLIDVRTAHEHEAGHIAGTPRIELGELSARAGEIDRARPVVFYCRSGGRSAMATQAFAEAGFDAHNMTGGMLEWDARGLPIAPEGGHVAEP